MNFHTLPQRYRKALKRKQNVQDLEIPGSLQTICRPWSWRSVGVSGVC